MLAQLLELLAQLALLRRHHRDRCRGCVGRLRIRGGDRRRCLATLPGADSFGAMIAFSTLLSPQTGQVTRPRLACLS